ncbi:MAG: arsenic resistance protein, partial [Chloroflexi bacterium]|nr:arsenic resistance protein [Chloroflexota bacterium]
MALGILIGKALGISNYDLTPPIDAIKSIFLGTYAFTIGNTLALGVVLGLFLMMYPAMTNVRVDELGRAFRSPKALILVVFFNYGVAPFFMFGLAKLFLSSQPELMTGLILYGIAPCIAMVIIFTFLARGNTPLALVLVAFNSIIQMLVIPLYAKLLIGEVRLDVLLVGESVVLYLGLPLMLGFLTRRIGVRCVGEVGFEKFRAALNALAILGLFFTMVVMFSLKGDLILERPVIVLQMAVPMALFFFVMFNVAYLTGWKAGLGYRDSVAAAFNSTGRDFEIAIAIALTAFSPTVALATVVGPLIEVPIMLTLVWIARRTEDHLFGALPQIAPVGLAVAGAADPPDGAVPSKSAERRYRQGGPTTNDPQGIKMEPAGSPGLMGITVDKEL